MNYIEYLNAAFDVLDRDARITVYHRSVFMQLFRMWNKSFWAQNFIVSSKEITASLHISRSTYSKVIKQLDEWGYIQYHLSIGRQVGGQVTMLPIDHITRILTSHQTDDNFCRPSIDRSSFLSFSFMPADNDQPGRHQECNPVIHQTSTSLDEKQADVPAAKTRTPCLPDNHLLSATHAPPACQTSSYNKINYKQENKINLSEREIMICYSIGKTSTHPDQSPLPSKKLNFVFSLPHTDSKQNQDLPPQPPIRSQRKRPPAKPFENAFTPPSRQQTTQLFAELKLPEAEANKFFNYYEKKGWTVGQGAPMTNLRAAILSWMDRYREFSFKEGRPARPAPAKEYFHVHNNNTKNYAQPL